MEELHLRYASPQGARGRWSNYRKRYTWIAVVSGALLLKRLIDFAGAALLLVTFSPVMFAVAITIKLTDAGPVFYLSTRIGQNGCPFQFPKFRSMRENAELEKAGLMTQNQHETGVTFKIVNDPRVTKIGKFIRRTSIDELPQLWCVFKGEMSLVGPRPPLPNEVYDYSLVDRKRLDIKPGITGPWQVAGRANLSFEKQVSLDLQYIESQSVFKDITILLKTVPAVLLGKGAY